MSRKPLYILLILTAFTIILTAQDFIHGSKTFGNDNIEYTHYNNYKIFKESFFHLIADKDLYVRYPEEHWDLYKYSPTFALSFAPLAYLPDELGLFLWNWLNCLVVFFALWKLPFKSDKIKMMALGFILLELITSLQNAQSNALITGLIVFAFIFLERKQIALASLFVVLTVFIKLFGLVALALFLFYPGKLRAIAYTIGWTILLVLLPLIVVSPDQLFFLYQSWMDLLVNDHSASRGLSVSGWLYRWFDLEPSKNLIALFGIVLFCVPFFKYRYFQELRYKLLYLASILIWVVIFNHKAESPTYIIAATGVAIWFFSQEQKMENTVLLVLVFIFTILSPTDFFPRFLRDAYVGPYVLKAVPCILIWAKITYDLITYKNDDNIEQNLIFNTEDH